MKIIMHTIAAGPAGTIQPGPKPQEVEDGLSRILIKGGYASHADENQRVKSARKNRGAPEMETAMAAGAQETTAATPQPVVRQDQEAA